MPRPGSGPHGPKPKIENPGKLFMRLMRFITKNYGIQFLYVSL